MTAMYKWEEDEYLKKYLLDWYIYLPGPGAMMKRQRPDHPFKAAPFFVGIRVKKKKRGSEGVIYIKGHTIIYARLAFLLMTGDWPKGKVIHINKNGFDQRWVNLRESEQE